MRAPAWRSPVKSRDCNRAAHKHSSWPTRGPTNAHARNRGSCTLHSTPPPTTGGMHGRGPKTQHGMKDPHVQTKTQQQVQHDEPSSGPPWPPAYWSKTLTQPPYGSAVMLLFGKTALLFSCPIGFPSQGSHRLPRLLPSNVSPGPCPGPAAATPDTATHIHTGLLLPAAPRPRTQGRAQQASPMTVKGENATQGRHWKSTHLTSSSAHQKPRATRLPASRSARPCWARYRTRCMPLPLTIQDSYTGQRAGKGRGSWRCVTPKLLSSSRKHIGSFIAKLQEIPPLTLNRRKEAHHEESAAALTPAGAAALAAGHASRHHGCARGPPSHACHGYMLPVMEIQLPHSRQLQSPKAPAPSPAQRTTGSWGGVCACVESAPPQRQGGIMYKAARHCHYVRRGAIAVASIVALVAPHSAARAALPGATHRHRHRRHCPPSAAEQRPAAGGECQAP